jgi:predicted house-cleaning noncanonical NTP pyrophosphatase (MazG superfamily)
MERGKLVRDLIPDIIRQNGEVPVTRRLDDEEYPEALLEKLLEEAGELAESPSLEERADIEEVLRAIDEHFGFTPQAVEEARREKHDKRGGFSRRIFLEGVE